MPITVRCPACPAAFKVRDEIAGKKVKCPKCGQVVAVPRTKEAPVPDSKPKGPSAAETVRAKAPPEVPALPPARKKAAVPIEEDAGEQPPEPRRRRQPARPAVSEEDAGGSFEDLAVPDQFRDKIEEEIGDERVVWLGRPDPAAMMKKGVYGIIVGAVLLLVAVVILVVALVAGLDGIMIAVAGFFAFVFLLGGIGLLLTPVWIKKFAHRRPVYVLTEERTVVLQWKLGRFDLRSYRPKDLEKMKLEVRADGSGNIIMGYDEHAHAHTTYRRRAGDRGNAQTGRAAELRADTSTVSFRIPVGFLELNDVETIDRLVRRTLDLPPPPEEEWEDD